MILYDYCRSSAAYRVRIALNLKGLDYQQQPINLVSGEQRSAAHCQRNSQGLVPVLEDNGVQISQSLAICAYLDEAYPTTAPLLQGSAAEKAAQHAFALAIACDIHPLNNLRVLQYLVAEMGVTETDKMQWYHHWISTTFAALEQQLAERRQPGTFCLSEQPSLADICLVPQMFNARRFKVDLDPYPLLVAVDQHCQQLPVFAAAHPDKQPGA